MYNNARIIEIIGPPGVGKTTIFDSLCQSWKPKENWIYPETLLTPAPAFSAFKEWIMFQLKSLLGRKRPKTISPEHGLRFIANSSALGEFYWDILSDSRVYSKNAINKRFRSSYFLFSDFCQYQAVLEANSQKYCVINEGLLQKSFLVHEDKDFMQDIVRKYLALLPLPSAVVCINTDNNQLVLERLRNRKKVIASHIGKDDKELMSDIENWQYYIELVTKEVSQRNVPVFTINAERSVRENAELIRNILHQQQGVKGKSYRQPAFVQ